MTPPRVWELDHPQGPVDLAPHTMTLEQECLAREGFDYALRMRLHHMQAKVRSLPVPALMDVLLSVHIYAASIEATIAQAAVAEAALDADGADERSLGDVPQRAVANSEAAYKVNDRVGAIA